MKKILQIKNLTKIYGTLKALDNLTITIEEGDVYGILGPNGSGKTTTLSIITGLIEKTSGSFRWFDATPDKPVNYKIGSVIEKSGFYPYMNLSDNLKIFSEIKQIRKNINTEIERVLSLTGLFKYKKMPYASLSLGMKQRFAISNALLGNPKVLILDEPTNGLDAPGFATVRNIIENFAAKGKTVILASHILSEVEKVCNKVAIIKKGRLITQTTIDKLTGTNRIIIQTNDAEKLKAILFAKNLAKDFENNNDYLVIIPESGVTPEDIAKIAMQNEILITKLDVKNVSLEESFLSIIKDK